MSLAPHHPHTGSTQWWARVAAAGPSGAHRLLCPVQPGLCPCDGQGEQTASTVAKSLEPGVGSRARGQTWGPAAGEQLLSPLSPAHLSCRDPPPSTLPWGSEERAQAGLGWAWAGGTGCLTSAPGRHLPAGAPSGIRMAAGAGCDFLPVQTVAAPGDQPPAPAPAQSLLGHWCPRTGPCWAQLRPHAHRHPADHTPGVPAQWARKHPHPANAEIPPGSRYSPRKAGSQRPPGRGGPTRRALP